MPYLKLAVGIITAIPQIKSLFEMLVDFYQDKQIKELQVGLSDKTYRRRALMNSIKNCKDINERKELSILLHKHITDQLPK